MATTRILSRTMYIDTRNGRIRPLDFCRINTTLGTAMEPRQLSDIPPSTNQDLAKEDFDDEMRKITKLEVCEWRDNINIFNGLHGGSQLPRDISY